MLDYARIRRMLPHGHPMVLVDRILALEPRVSIVGVKAVTASDACYGNVPPEASFDRYAYPVSLLLESFGQTAAILWLASFDDAALAGHRVMLLAGIRNCRIEGRAFPGDVLQHAVHLEYSPGDHILVTGETRVGERRIAVIESMIAAIRPLASLIEQAAARGAGDAARPQQPIAEEHGLRATHV